MTCTGVVPMPPPLQLKLAAWPMADRLAWEAASDPGNVLDGCGPVAGWAPATRRSVTKAYGRWLAWIVATASEEADIGPGRRVTPQRVAAYVSDLRSQCVSITIVAYIQGLAMAMDAMVPSAAWGWLWDIHNRLKRVAVPSRDKRTRLVPSSDLFALGLDLMNRPDAAVAAKGPQYVAARYRDGLMIALLAARPFRLKNFTSMTIGQHIVHANGRYDLRFTAAEMKTRKAMELPFPTELVPYLETYLTEHRPILLLSNGHARVPSKSSAETSGLWISIFGRQMAEVSVHGRMVELTRRAFGKSVNPHLFRDCAATSIALQDPQHSYIIMSVLGHSSLATSERYYNHASALKANEAYQTNVLALRREAASHARAERRRAQSKV